MYLNISSKRLMMYLFIVVFPVPKRFPGSQWHPVHICWVNASKTKLFPAWGPVQCSSRCLACSALNSILSKFLLIFYSTTSENPYWPLPSAPHVHHCHKLCQCMYLFQTLCLFLYNILGNSQLLTYLYLFIQSLPLWLDHMLQEG